MSKAVMISIQPKYSELIASGKKTIEVRKTAPKLETPFKCYIYCTKGRGKNIGNALLKNDGHIEMFNYQDLQLGTPVLNGKVIGEFVCDKISHILGKYNDKWALDKACLTEEEAGNYLGRIDSPMCYTIYGIKSGYAWHISNPVIYDAPKELGEFWKYGYENDYDAYSAVGGGVPISFNSESYKVARPPQSWCYVEEV